MQAHVDSYNNYLMQRDYVLIFGIQLPKFNVHNTTLRNVIHSYNSHVIAQINQLNHNAHVVTFWLFN